MLGRPLRSPFSYAILPSTRRSIASLIDLLFCVEIVRGLQAIEARILSIAIHEFVVAPLFLNAPIGKIQDAVGHTDGGEAVADQQSQASPSQFVKTGVDAILALHVQRG